MNIWKETDLCSDFSYFCENYIKIHNPKLGVIPFRQYDYQKRMFKYLESNQLLMCKKFRQGGFTTLVNVYLFWKCLFNQNIKTCSLFIINRESLIMSEAFRQIIQELPDWIKSKIVKITDHEIRFTTNSKMFFYSSNEDLQRGISLDYVVFDECAFWKKETPENFLLLLANKTKLFVVSTYNGKENWFHETYENAQNNTNGYKIFNCSYTEHPDYANQEWEENVKNALGIKLWKRDILGID